MKEILVVNATKTCSKCELYFRGTCGSKHKFLMDDEISKTRPSWCPLKPLPKKKEIDKTLKFGGYENIIQEALARGYNACRDEITGETE